MSAFDCLAGELRWVVWRNEKRGDKGKPTKVPYAPFPHRGKAKADDPSTWGTRGEAEMHAEEFVGNFGGGVGLELGDLGGDTYIGGVDLDSCLDEDGTPAAWAQAIIEALPSYGEISPSGTGLKLFFYVASENVRPFLALIGCSPEQWGCRRDAPGKDGRDHGPAVELYLSHRYFAVTGQRWPDLPDRIVLLDWEDLQRIAHLIPPPRCANNSSSAGIGDHSRSAKAFRTACRMKAAGHSFEEMVDALRADPETADWVEDKGEPYGGRELHRLWDRTAAPTTSISPKSKREIQLIDFADMEARLDWTWLVEGLLMPEQISVVWGLPGCRKTFMCLDIGLHVAANLSWLGRRVETGLVIYVAAEAGNTIRQRVAAWKIEHGYQDEKLPFAVVPHAIDLCHAAAGDCDALIEKIREAAGQTPVALIVIDTVNRSLGGGNENGPEDMGAFSGSLDRFRDQLHCHVLGVHHCGKNPALGARGHSLLIGNIDTEFEVIADHASQTSIATMRKQRDAEPASPFSFGLKSVILGTNQVGQVINSCIVMPAEISSTPKVAKPKRSPKNQIAFDALVKAIDTGGITPPSSNHVSPSSRGVSIELWRTYYYAMVPAADEKEKAKRKSAFWRAREALQGEKPAVVIIWNEYAWIVPG